MVRLDILKQVRDLLGEQPEKFDYGSWPPVSSMNCGSPGCVGGWCNVLLYAEGNIFDSTGERLGLSRAESDFLFYPDPFDFNRESFTDSYLIDYPGNKEYDYATRSITDDEESRQEAINRIQYIIDHYSQE